MSHQLVIYGASDDLIEIEGDFTDEIGAYSSDEEQRWLAISDGTLLRVQYDGVWRFTVVRKGRANLTKVEAPEDDERNYSDRVTLSQEDPFTWALLGDGLAKGAVQP